MKYWDAIYDYCYFKYVYKNKGFAGCGKSLSF